MLNRRWIVVAVTLIAGIASAIALFSFVRAFILRPATTAADFQLVEVAKGFTNPLYVTAAGDNSQRLFVVEQDGLVRIVQNGQVLATPFLDVKSLVSRNDSERGLLGLAFHPQYATNGQFFINYTDLKGDTVVARYHVSAADPNKADAQSAALVIHITQPFPNHNAGQLAFGPDGYLYLGLGDGGSGGDPNHNGQNPSVLLGKMLRLDVDSAEPYAVPPDNPFMNTPNFAPEIWAWGLRNPWRYSFDRATGDLYIADVGQNTWEEIDFQPAGQGGVNYGWNAFEGMHRFSDTPAPADAVMPIAEYSHADGCSVTGGYVYRGVLAPALQGVYLFGDFCTGTLWGTNRDSSGNWQTRLLMNTGRVISSFGEDEIGEVYLVDYSGILLRFEAVGR